MLRAPLSLPRFRLHRVATSVSLAAALVLFCNLGVAFSSDPNDLLDPSIRAVQTGRAKGLAHIDLPMRIRAHFDTTYTDQSYISDELAMPYMARVGPRVRNDQALESRIALTRSISDRIEIGFVCGARSPLSSFDLFDFERLTVGAMVRIVP